MKRKKHFDLLVPFLFCSTLFAVTAPHRGTEGNNTSLFCPPARPSAWLKHKPRLSRSLRRGDWHSGGRGLSASCTGHYSRRMTRGCLDPHCQHINLSASWIHQGHRRVADSVMDNCCASFLCRLFSFYWSTSWIPQCSFSSAYAVLEVFQPRQTQRNDGSPFFFSY